MQNLPLAKKHKNILTQLFITWKWSKIQKFYQNKNVDIAIKSPTNISSYIRNYQNVITAVILDHQNRCYQMKCFRICLYTEIITSL